MKRPLLVFAGQSNMMGAAVYPPKEQIVFAQSFEYLHKPRRFGCARGEFKSYGFPSGEFSYYDLEKAYGGATDPTAKSTLADYGAHTYFCPSMSNLTVVDGREGSVPFAVYSEANMQPGVCLPPYLVELLEKEGLACAYAHITKAGVPISFYLSEGEGYFAEKVRDFFADSEAAFPQDDTSCRVLLWHQGESDGGRSASAYLADLTALRAQALSLGFTHICILRVGIWGDPAIADIMRAQEEFCRIYPDCHMLTRVASYIPWAGMDNTAWLAGPIPEECQNCRDSFFGFGNQHINDKGFRTMAAHAAPNLIRVLAGEEPILEEERILPLLDENVNLG